MDSRDEETKQIPADLDEDGEPLPKLSAEELAAQEAEVLAMAKADGPLNVKNLIALMTSINNSFAANQILIKDYNRAINTWCQVFTHLGAAIAYAFRDSKEKAKDILDNQILMVETLGLVDAQSPEGMYLIPFCGLEAKLGCIALNRDDNKKKLLKKVPKDKQQDWMKNYCSTARTLYRNEWLFSFLSYLIQLILSERDQKLSKIARATYKKTLAPHHPYWLQKVAGAACGVTNSREKFIAGLQAEQS